MNRVWVASYIDLYNSTPPVAIVVGVFASRELALQARYKSTVDSRCRWEIRAYEVQGTGSLFNLCKVCAKPRTNCDCHDGGTFE